MNFEDEMNRFEAEINRAAFIGAATAYSSVQRRLQGMAAAAAAVASTAPAPPVLDPALIPAQIHSRAGLPPPPTQLPVPGTTAPPKVVVSGGPAVISAPPQTQKPPESAAAADPATKTKAPDDDEEDVFSKLLKYEKELKKEKKEKKKKAKTSFMPSSVTSKGSTSAAAPTASAAPVPTAAPPSLPQSKPFAPVTGVPAHSVPASATIGDDALKKAKKQKRIVRTGGGQIWEDQSLKDWDPNDFRLFCGDLGNDVTDEVLARTFGRYPSFQRAKVIRDKKTNKTKGYGFVSFRDPTDFTKAVREINGKYVGSRPIKLRKSNWKDRNIEEVRKKQKLKQQMGYKW